MSGPYELSDPYLATVIDEIAKMRAIFREQEKRWNGEHYCQCGADVPHDGDCCYSCRRRYAKGEL